MKKAEPIKRSPFKRAIGKYLKRIRLQAGFRQNQAAQAVGISQQQLCNYGNGGNGVPLMFIGRFVELYGTDRLKVDEAIRKACRLLKNDRTLQDA